MICLGLYTELSCATGSYYLLLLRPSLCTTDLPQWALAQSGCATSAAGNPAGEQRWAMCPFPPQLTLRIGELAWAMRGSCPHPSWLLGSLRAGACLYGRWHISLTCTPHMDALLSGYLSPLLSGYLSTQRGRVLSKRLVSLVFTHLVDQGFISMAFPEVHKLMNISTAFVGHKA